MPESLATEHNRSLFAPLAVGLLTMLIWAGFQTVQLVHEQGKLKQVYANQETPLQAAQKMRTKMDVIASGTLKLAIQGNANAKVIIQSLANRGITIDPDAKTPAPPRRAGDAPTP
jgi:hypothetical protein